MSSTVVSCSWAGYLCATAQRGSRVTNPSWRLQRQAVDLVNHTVNVVGQLIARSADALVISYQFSSALRTYPLGLRPENPIPSGSAACQSVCQRRATLLHGCDLAQAIGEKAQGALGGNARIELAHGTCGGVARVHKGFLAFAARCFSLSASKSSRRM
jgi:hypothetical protein